MAVPSTQEITQLLVAWNNGDAAALEQLTPLVQAELHRLAKRYMAGERQGHILQTTALVNEAFMRLIDWQNVEWQNRAHFFGMAAQIMRRILMDFARARNREKRGGDAMQVSLSEAANVADGAVRGSGGAGRRVADVGEAGPAASSCSGTAFLRRAESGGDSRGAQCFSQHRQARLEPGRSMVIS